MPNTVYAPLLAYLRDARADRVFLTFAEIEAIIGRPLALSAQVTPSYWTNAPYIPFVRDLQALGWRAHLEVRRQRVAFRRAAAAHQPRNPPPRTEPSVQVGVYLPLPLHVALDAVVSARGTSRQAVIELALRTWLDREEEHEAAGG